MKVLRIAFLNLSIVLPAIGQVSSVYDAPPPPPSRVYAQATTPQPFGQIPSQGVPDPTATMPTGSYQAPAAITGLGGGVSDVASGAVDAAAGVGSSAVGQVGDVAVGTYDAAGNAIGGVTSGATGFVDSASSAAADATARAAEYATGATTSTGSVGEAVGLVDGAAASAAEAIDYTAPAVVDSHVGHDHSGHNHGVEVPVAPSTPAPFGRLGAPSADGYEAHATESFDAGAPMERSGAEVSDSISGGFRGPGPIEAGRYNGEVYDIAPAAPQAAEAWSNEGAVPLELGSSGDLLSSGSLIPYDWLSVSYDHSDLAYANADSAVGFGIRGSKQIWKVFYLAGTYRHATGDASIPTFVGDVSLDSELNMGTVGVGAYYELAESLHLFLEAGAIYVDTSSSYPGGQFPSVSVDETNLYLMPGFRMALGRRVGVDAFFLLNFTDLLDTALVRFDGYYQVFDHWDFYLGATLSDTLTQFHLGTRFKF